MLQTEEQKQYMEEHKEFVRMLNLITSFDFWVALQAMKKDYVGKKSATKAKQIYYEVYDEIYKNMKIPGQKEKFTLDKSNQFREAFKRFVAIQDEDMDGILKLMKKEKTDFSEEEMEDLRCCVKNCKVMFRQLLGGRIAYHCNDKETNASRNPHRLYYFIPDTDNSKMDFLTGMVLSNSMIAPGEKKKLLECMYRMNPAYEEILILNDGSEDDIESSSKKIQIPSKNEKFLKHVRTLYMAVMKKWKIEIVYGIYDRTEDNQIRFRAKHNQEKTILNPFALLWNNGHYYLIATTEEKPEAPRHYRVDRFIEVALAKGKGEQPLPRCKIPELLRIYYPSRNSEWFEFQAEKYLREHPGMRIYQEKNLIDCTFEMTDWELQMMVDAFGTDLTIVPKKGAVTTRVDYNGEERQLYTVTVKKVQYENALSFALQHAEYITVREPRKLVDDVRKWLEKMLNQLNEKKNR